MHVKLRYSSWHSLVITYLYHLYVRTSQLVIITNLAKDRDFKLKPFILQCVQVTSFWKVKVYCSLSVLLSVGTYYISTWRHMFSMCTHTCMLLNMCTNKTIETIYGSICPTRHFMYAIHISEHECDTPVLHMNFSIWTYIDSVSESFYTISKHTGVFRHWQLFYIA